MNDGVEKTGTLKVVLFSIALLGFLVASVFLMDSTSAVISSMMVAGLFGWGIGDHFVKRSKLKSNVNSGSRDSEKKSSESSVRFDKKVFSEVILGHSDKM